VVRPSPFLPSGKGLYSRSAAKSRDHVLSTGRVRVTFYHQPCLSLRYCPYPSPTCWADQFLFNSNLNLSQYWQTHMFRFTLSLTPSNPHLSFIPFSAIFPVPTPTSGSRPSCGGFPLLTTGLRLLVRNRHYLVRQLRQCMQQQQSYHFDLWTQLTPFSLLRFRYSIPWG